LSRSHLSRRHALVTLAFAAALFAAGCSSRSSQGQDARVPGTLRYAISTEPTTLDPAMVSDGPTIDLLQNVYEGLVGWDDKNQVVPKLAAAMPDVSSDGTVYTFTLRGDATFTNGRKVTAEDVKHSLTRALDPKLSSPVAATYLNDIEGAQAVMDGKTGELAGVKAIDPRTVQITLSAPRAYFLGKLTYPTGYVVAREEVARGPSAPGGAKTIDETNTVGTGPFRLRSYTRQDRVVLEANADYWGGKPRLQVIERPIVLNAQQRHTLYEQGQLDLLIDMPTSDYERDREDPNLKDHIKFFNRAQVFYLGMNQTHYKPFKDKRVRQAFAHAIDKDAVVAGVMQDVSPRAEGIVPIGVPGYDPNFKGIPYDPARGKALLAEAGYPDGNGLPPLQLSFRESTPNLRKGAEILQEQLKQVGVPITLREMEWAAFLRATDARQIDLFHMRWAADYPDPQNFLSVLLHSKAPENRTAYNNPAYDALLDKADSSLDQEERIALYRKAERIVVDDAPWVPLYFQRDVELHRPYVKGIRSGLMGHLPHTTTTVD
jgi:ABC-type transport system substrate-binding protein